MLCWSASSGGMRQVPVTNSQKSSGSRLHYKTFVGARTAHSIRRSIMSNPLPIDETEPEWAAFAAIDWADQKHAWRLVPAGSAIHEKGELENTPEAVDQWAANLYVRFGGRLIAIGLEQSRGALLYMLSKYAHLV